MCRINPRVDFAFKKLFGSEENKDLLISLINAIVSESDRVTDIELKNPYNLAEYKAGKMSILDIKALDRNRKHWYNIEMQISEDLNFDKRAIYYWAKLVTEQLSEGRMFRELKKTVSINILDFNFVPDTPVYHNLYRIINTATGRDDRLHDIFELHYIELRKFRKEYQELVYPLDRWITFLTRAHELKHGGIPDALAEDRAILKAIEAVDRMFDEEERQIYETRMQSLADVESKIASAEEKGLAQGMEKGIAKGIEQGIEKGIKKGIEKGMTKGIAQSLLTVLTAKFGVLPDTMRARVEGADCGQLEQWMDSVFAAECLGDIFREAPIN